LATTLLQAASEKRKHVKVLRMLSGLLGSDDILEVGDDHDRHLDVDAVSPEASPSWSRSKAHRMNERLSSPDVPMRFSTLTQLSVHR
jgi:hypothetical protein